ncbi:MAG TPA: hypothetical protein P5555_04815 [Candidatus Paceibacterota bacterium]|nr:hypothetical protein [Verrucomicrobiota bacterium]HRZ44492.1 hypothetical protein [Candidatus Paceibacterota bacterium]
MKKHCWIWLLALEIAMTNAAAAEASSGAERVGSLGGEDRLLFDGAQAFSREGILRTLAMSLEFHARSHPSAPLADHLAWIEQTMSRGYQNRGFAKATVTAQADRQEKRIRVRIDEGPRFLCGDIRVSGLEPALAEPLKDRLRAAAAILESPPRIGGPGFDWPWREGDPVPANPASLAALQRSVVTALTELNRHQAKVRVELDLDETRRRADLRIEVENPGVAGVLDQIEVAGLQASSRDDLLAFLELHPGMALAGSVTNDAVRQLYDSGRFRAQRARLSPLSEPGRFRLDVEVVEYANAPPLHQPLTAEEQACLKLRDWIMQWQTRAEDWVVELDGMRGDRRDSVELVLGSEGLAAVHRQRQAAHPSRLDRGLVASPRLVFLCSESQRSKWAGNHWRGQLTAFVLLNSLPSQPADDDGGFNFSLGGGWQTASRSGSAGAPFGLRLELAPVAFVHLAHLKQAVCRVEQGVLSIRGRSGTEGEMDLMADAATGRLIRFSATQPSELDRWSLAVRSEEGAFARMVREVDASSSALTNALDPAHPWSSSLAFLGREFLRAFPGVLDRLDSQFRGGLTLEEALGLVSALAEMPWDDLLAPFDRSSNAAPPEDDGEPFPLLLDGPLPDTQTAGDWARLAGGFILRGNDSLWPRGSWPWATTRAAVFLASGQSGSITNDLPQLAQANDIGPVGCLVAAQAVGRFDPALAAHIARAGGARATIASFQNDLRVLLRGQTAGPRFLRGALRQASLLENRDARSLARLLGTNNLPLILDSFTALTATSNQPPDEALRPVVERHWTNNLHPRLLTAFAERSLSALQMSPPRQRGAQAAEAAGWLQKAAGERNARAQMLLAQLCLEGMGVPRDPAAGAHWLRQAAEQHFPHAGCTLARLYRDGAGVPKNLDEAARWFRREAEAGCTTAMFALAVGLLTRESASPADHDEAIRWLRASARSGSVQAQSRLGELFSDGIVLEPDYAEAWVWFTLAAEQGQKLAAIDARRLEKKLTAGQLSIAQQRLQELRQQSNPKPEDAASTIRSILGAMPGSQSDRGKKTSQ